MTARAPLVDRFVVGVDVERYSGRHTRHQDMIRRDLDELLRQAASATGLDRNLWSSMGTGDGELAVLPADVDMVPVVNGLVRELNSRLLVRNEDHAPDLQIRLRVAMHIDTLIESVQGHAGPALNELARLLDSTPVREALKQVRPTAAAVALLISEPVYRKVVQSGFGELRPRHFRRVEVDIPAKAFSQPAYLHVPNHDMSTFPSGWGTPEGPEGEEPPSNEDPPNDDAPDDRPRSAASPDDRTDSDPAEGQASTPQHGAAFNFTAGRDLQTNDVFVGTKNARATDER